MRKAILLILMVSLVLGGCQQLPQSNSKQYTATFLTLFDTVTIIVGTAETEEDFHAKAQKIHDDLLFYHQRFDIYNDYDGISNLKTINDHAGDAPVTVDETVIALLKDCKRYYSLTDGKVNAAMGSVLSLWHDARTDGLRDPVNAQLPKMDALTEAAKHTDFDKVVIDETACTVVITDAQVSLDVGAIAKGWATQRAAEKAPAGMLISVGGNVCATGPKKEDGTPWVIGIQDPDNSSENLHTIYVTSGSVVTSGDYQRTYSVDGKRYHHIIDPETCMPSEYWRSVTVVCADSGLADALSTALFLLPLEQGMALAAQNDAEVIWIDTAGEEYMTDGFREMIRT